MLLVTVNPTNSSSVAVGFLLAIFLRKDKVVEKCLELGGNKMNGKQREQSIGVTEDQGHCPLREGLQLRGSRGCLNALDNRPEGEVSHSCSFLSLASICQVCGQSCLVPL